MTGSPAGRTVELAHIFPGDSQMAALMRAFDWSTTDLGPPQTWPHNLRTALSICLTSRFPLQVWWGSALTLFPNDASIAFLGPDKHPAVLGRSGPEAWAEIWDTIRPMVESVLTTGTASGSQDILMLFDRDPSEEEVYVTFSFSPAFGLDGRVDGLFCVCHESTEKVVGVRRDEPRHQAGDEAASRRSDEDLEQRVRERTRELENASAALRREADDRKRTAEALRASEERFRAIVTQATVGIAETAYGRFTYVNDRFCEITGRGRDELLGIGFGDITHSEDRVRDRGLVERMYATGEPFVVDKRFVRPDGSIVWVLNGVAPLREADGRITGGLATSIDVTKRKRAEAALMENEQLLRHLIRNIPAGSLNVFDRDLRYLFAEGQGLAQVGISPEQLVGKTLSEVFPPEAVDYVTPYYRSAFTGETLNFELEVAGRWYVIHTAPLRDGQDSINAIIALALDITERKRTEAALRTSEEWFRLMADAVPQIVWTTDPDGRIEFFNKHWTDYTGVPYEPTTAAQVAASFVHPHDAPRTLEAFGEARRTGHTFQVEHRIRSATGDYRWFLVRAEPYRDQQTGDIVRWFGASIDIHDRKLAEAALRASEERLRLVLESVQDYAIFTVDPTGLVMSWNDGAYRLKGYIAEEILGQSMQCFYTDEDVAAGKPAHEFETALAAGRSEDESWRVRKDGSLFWVNEIMTPLYADDGTHLGFTKVSRDLTARKQADDAVARALVAEQVARTEAEAALKTRDQFLSIASHELRTPLTPLLGYTEMLRRSMAQTVDGPQRKLLDTIERQAHRLNRLIETLLDVSRLQRGQFTLESQPLDLAVLAAHTVAEFRLTLPPDGTGHTITMAEPDAAVAVVVDAHRMEEVLHNLLTNAVKYSPVGSTIGVRVARHDGEAMLEVADAGIGIPAEARAQVFEPFYRAANVGQTVSGFGLGLYIVQEIVRRHGGHVEVESTEGQGTTFRVILPLSTP